MERLQKRRDKAGNKVRQEEDGERMDGVWKNTKGLKEEEPV